MTTFAGYVAILGRPNVGKSTLLNHLLGQKLSITSRKPQTTRHQMLGVLSDPSHQLIFVDTPGIHDDQKSLLNQLMNKAAWHSIHDVDVLCFVLDARGITTEDKKILQRLNDSGKPIVCLLNKTDLINQNTLLPMVAELNQQYPEMEVIPISALKSKNLDVLKKSLYQHLPSSPFFFPEEMVTDRDRGFIITEFIREKVFRTLGQELPYASAVTIEKYLDEPKITKIHALIMVEREGQKKIIIGKQGEKLKQIGTSARLEIEKYLGKKVFLQLWVKVKRGWSDSERELQNLGL